MKALLGRAIHRVWHGLKRDDVNRALREFDRNQWLSEDELLDLQRRKLKELLLFAGRHVPYYRDAFAASGTIADTNSLNSQLLRLQPLTKDVIRQVGASLISENLVGNSLKPNSTSGSTGKPIQFYTDARSVAFRTAAELRSNEFTGWRQGEKWATLWGAPMDVPRGKAFRSWLRGIVNRRIFLSSFDLSQERLEEYTERLLAFKPVLIVGYPGPLEQLAKYCQSKNVYLPSLSAIVSSAETLWPHQREVIEQTFQVKIFNRYGSREVGQVSSECEFHNGMHVSIDRVLIEIVRDDGTVCAPGETGRILVTDLDNYGMPLIRYDIGDRATATAGGKCECGRGLPKIQAIEGRTLEVIRTRQGHKIGGTFWTLLLRSRPGFHQFQVVQTDVDGVTINFVRDPEVSSLPLDYFDAKIRETCGSTFAVDFVERDEIELTPAGKQRIIISKISPPTEISGSQDVVGAVSAKIVSP